MSYTAELHYAEQTTHLVRSSDWAGSAGNSDGTAVCIQASIKVTSKIRLTLRS
jgi:hypothetical protein